MPALLGSAMIAFGFIPAACILYNQHSDILIETGPIAREVRDPIHLFIHSFLACLLIYLFKLDFFLSGWFISLYAYHT